MFEDEGAEKPNLRASGATFEDSPNKARGDDFAHIGVSDEVYVKPMSKKKRFKVLFHLTVKFLVTFLFVPFVCWFSFHVYVDTSANGKWSLADTPMHYIILVVFPNLSFLGMAYVIVSYWMDESCWTILRMRTMFAAVPLCIFFMLMLMGQSTHFNSLSCGVEGYIQQVCYLQTNMWQTMTVFTAYNYIVRNQARYKGTKRIMVHCLCWGLPILLTTTLTLIDDTVWHKDLFDSELRGIGWCGVDSERRILKAVFVNTPQLIAVSAYAQLYYYIHQRVDPEIDEDLEQTAKLSTSANTKLLSLDQLRRETYVQETAAQLRLQMSAYMLSFLTNTLVTLVSDNMFVPGTNSDSNLLLQTGVVTCQGFLAGIVYARTANKGLLTAYFDTFQDLMAMISEEWARKLKLAQEQRRAKAAERLKERKKVDISFAGQLERVFMIFYQSVLLFPVSVWVWVPMGFIAEITDNKRNIFLGLVVWGITSVFPIYAFSLVKDTSGTSSMSTGEAVKFQSDETLTLVAHGFLIFIFFITALSLFMNRYTHQLLMIERAVRRKGLFGKIGQGLRLTSMRNCMTIFTLTLEFYQVFGLTWSASRMPALYEGRYSEEQVAAIAAANATQMVEVEPRPEIFGMAKEIVTYWIVIVMVIGWVILYSLPAVITTTTVGNREFSYNLMEKVRGYLWFMAGAGFLTIIKAMTKILFCIDDRLNPGGPPHALTDPSIICWTDQHLRMVAIALLSMALFFPSASLTTLFRYDDEDDRSIVCHLGGCVLGGEDIRWIHMWRRAEYMVKGAWVFTGMKFANDGAIACAFLWIGSIVIVIINWYIQPSNLKVVCRQKLNIHVCNIWTTMTCFWAATTLNENQTVHYAIMVAGWAIVWVLLWGYEIKAMKASPFMQEIGDQANIDKCRETCERLGRDITHSTGIMRWGSHARIVEVGLLCEHPDVEVQRSGFRWMCNLAFWDQMTTDYSFFLRLTSTDPTVKNMIDAIETSEDAEIRNLATRTLNSFLQTNTGNRYGVPVTFHSTLQLYDDEKDGEIASIISKYAHSNCEDAQEQMDAMQLALELGQSDSNDLLGIVDEALPLINDWLDTGNVLQQFLATQLLSFISARFDLVPKVTASGAIEHLCALFQNVCDGYSQFETTSSEPNTDFGFKTGEANVSPTQFQCQTWSLPKKYKRILKVAGDATAGADLGVSDITVLEASHIKMIHADILTFAIESLVDCAFSLQAEGRRSMLDTGILDTVLARCFAFDASDNPLADDSDIQVTTELHVEGCRLAQAFLSGAFSEQDIAIDDEFHDYFWQLQRFIDDVRTADDEDAAEFHVFDGLNPVQRRKAHIIAEFHRLEHESIGPPSSRRVQVYRPNASDKSLAVDEDFANPLARDASAAAYTAKNDGVADNAVDKEGEDAALQTIYNENYQRVADCGIAHTVLQLAARESTDEKVTFNVCDVLLRLLEHDVDLSAEDLAQVRRLMLAGVGSPSHGFSIMCSTAVEILVVRDNLYVPCAHRKAFYGTGIRLFRSVAKQIYWMMHWNINAAQSQMAMDLDSVLEFA